MRPDRVATKLGKLEIYLRGLGEKRGISREEYLKNPDLRDIVERRFEKAVQACLDIASHMVAAEGFREPENYGDLFRVLEEEGVLSPETSGYMVEMAGFRNVLAHEYSSINDEIVYSHLHDLDGFRRFAEEIQGFVEETA